jgi:hypothetical protein
LSAEKLNFNNTFKDRKLSENNSLSPGNKLNLRL